MRRGGADVAGAVFAAAVLCAADPTRTVVATPVSWLVVTAGAAVVVGLAAWQRTFVVPARWVGITYLAFLAWLALAAAGGEDGRFAWLGIPQRHAGWLLWLLCGALFVSGVRWRAVVDGLVVAGLIWLPLLVADAFGHPWVDAGTQRLTGPFGSAAYLGAAGCLVAPAALGVALDDGRRVAWRRAAAVAAASAFFGAVGSGSRAAWLALVLVAAVAAWRARRDPRLPKIAAAAAAVGVCAALLTPVGARLASSTDADAAGGASRLDEWRIGAVTLAGHPLLGAGPEGYRIVVHEGIDAAYEREHGRAVQPDRAHNGLLDLALAGGVPAAILYASFVTAAAVAVRRRTRGRRWSPALAGAIAAIVAYLLQQQLLFPLAELEPVLFLLAGGVVCSGRPALRMPRAASLAGAAAAAVLAVAAIWWGVRDVAAWHAADAAAAAIDRGDLAAAQGHSLDALGWRSDEVWLHLLAARSAPTAEAALADVDAALALSPGDPIALQRRQELLVTLDPATAFEELHDLVAADPHNAALQLLYGTAAIRTGDEQIAEQAWLRALDLAPGSPGPRQNLITLYRHQGRDADADALEEAGTDGR